MSIVSRLINNPNAYSLETLQQGVQNGTIPPYIGIPLIQQKMQEKQEAQGMQQAQMGKMPSVAEQVMSQVSRTRGIDNLPSNLPTQYAEGGIVAFAGGGASSLAKMLFDDEEDDDYLDAIQSAMGQLESMRSQGVGSAPVSYAAAGESPITMASYTPSLMSKESKEGVSVKVGDMPAKTVEHRTKEVSKPAGLEDMLALVQQKESGGRRYGPSGDVLTSPKGAMGEMQVMPGTARDPGFGIRPAKPGDLDDLARVGREYFARMLEKYGDPKIAAVAYNWGPGNTDKWLAAGADPSMLPDETRKYMKGFAEGGITSIPRFQFGGVAGLTAAEMMSLSLADLDRMAKMGEPGAAEEMMRRQANRGIGPARMSGTPAMDLRNPTVTGGAPAAPAAAAPAEGGVFSRFLGPLEKAMTSPFARAARGAGVMSLLAPSSLNEGEQAELERRRKMPPAIYEGPNAPPVPPAHALRMEEERRQRAQDVMGAQEREDLEMGRAMQALAPAPAAPTPDMTQPPAAPAAPAESQGMSALRQYIQEGMAEAKNQKEVDKYMALLQAGLGMLGGSSRIASENIGRGALMGAQAYQEAAKARSADQKSLLAAQLGLEKYEQFGKLREAQLTAGTASKEERDRLQASHIASRMESDWMNRAEQTARAQISKNPLISMDEAKSNAYIQEARAAARNKLNMHVPYRKLLMKAYEGYDPGQIDIGPEMESLIGKYLQPKK